MLTSTLLVNLLLLCAGVTAGFFLAKALRPVQKENKNQKELAIQLAETQDDLSNYQQEVAAHFRKTSEVVSDLSKSHKSVLESFASAALHLTTADISRQIINSTFGADKTMSLASEDNLQPPKDYAPKAPGGILSEEYGLKEDRSLTNAQHISSNSETDCTLEEGNDDPTLNIS
ncbi:MAG: uncharacterized membrane-anchored protein YhcB (DUF1043 family) [Porticoccus sp.]